MVFVFLLEVWGGAGIYIYIYDNKERGGDGRVVRRIYAGILVLTYQLGVWEKRGVS